MMSGAFVIPPVNLAALLPPYLSSLLPLSDPSLLAVESPVHLSLLRLRLQPQLVESSCCCSPDQREMLVSSKQLNRPSGEAPMAHTHKRGPFLVHLSDAEVQQQQQVVVQGAVRLNEPGVPGWPAAGIKLFVVWVGLCW